MNAPEPTAVVELVVTWQHLPGSVLSDSKPNRLASAARMKCHVAALIPPEMVSTTLPSALTWPVPTIAKAPVFLRAAEQVAVEMNEWSKGFLGRPIVDDWQAQLDFTTKIFRARGLHLDDRHVRCADGSGFSASIVDAVLYIVNNYRALRSAGSSRLDGWRPTRSSSERRRCHPRPRCSRVSAERCTD